jgi:TatA/E family protein of Tat protein translocase
VGPIGVQEMIAIFIIALVLFGPKKLPELGRMLGKALSEFRRAKNELRASLEGHLSELERETRLADSSAHSANSLPASYPHPYEDYGRQTYDSELHSAPLIEAPAPQSAPVPDSVPRSNGTYSARPAANSTEEERAL